MQYTLYKRYKIFIVKYSVINVMFTNLLALKVSHSFGNIVGKSQSCQLI